jgi:NitT/TauT family transport system substrate-binding protein
MRALLIVVLAVVLVGAGSVQGAPAGQATAAPTADNPLVPITLFAGYVPNIQFAPVYAAMDQGFFREAGLQVTMENSFDETDGLTRIATNHLQFGLIGGDQVLLARAQGAPVKAVYRWYQKFPVGIVSPADSKLTDPKQLAGKVVGTPVTYGASYIGLQALLYAVGLKESDLKEVRAIGFDTAPIVCARQVDASVIYIANEPAQIEKRCFPVYVIPVSDYANIVSNGLVTNETTLKDQPDLVRSMVAAFNRGVLFTIDHPDQAYQSSRKYVESLAENDPVQQEVLARSIELWKADQPGYSDPAAWQLTADTLIKMGLISGPFDAESAFTNEFLPK